MEEKPNVVKGVWKVLRPDTRQYKQQSIEIEMSVVIELEVPEEYIVGSGPVLNLAGMKWVQEQFEKLYLEPIAIASKEEEWNDDGETTKEKKTEAEEADGWDADPVFDEDDNKMSGNKPDAEKWNENEEDWK